jgi:tRNA 2-thiouridine synthesizing protein C
MTKRILLLVRGLPRAGALANETLDLILVTAAFDLRPTVLFMGEAVFQLIPSAPGASTGVRDVGRAYAALPTYDVDVVYVEADAITRYGLDTSAFSVRSEVLDTEGIRALIAAHDVVFTG